MGLEERAVDREIDGITYRAWPLPFGVGQKALMRTMRIVFPIMSAATTKDMTRILEVIPTALSDQDIDYFSEQFGGASQYKEGENWVPLVKAAQNMHFAGRYEQFLRWLILNMEVNFGGFFAGMASGTNAADLAQMLTRKQ